MTERISVAKTGLRLLALVWLSCAITSYKTFAVAIPLAQPESLEYLLTSDGSRYFEENIEILNLINRLKDLLQKKQEMTTWEHDMSEELSEVESLLQMRLEELRFLLHPDYAAERSEATTDPLSKPSRKILLRNQQSFTKRKPNKIGLSYSALCHFKICNLGIKRQ